MLFDAQAPFLRKCCFKLQATSCFHPEGGGSTIHKIVHLSTRLSSSHKS